MNCKQAAELFPWYLESTLDAGESRRLGEHLETCGACLDELSATADARLLFGGHPPIGRLLDYAAGAPGVPRDLIESHLEECQDCAEELAMALASRAEARRASPASQPGASRRPAAAGRPAPRPLWRAAAVAAGLTALIGVAGGLWGWRASERAEVAERRVAELEAELRARGGARVNVPIHDLWPDGSVLRSAEAGPAILPAEAGPAATLILNSQLEPGRRPDRLEIRDDEGRLIDSLSGVRVGPAGTITLSLALARLPPGELRILVFDADGEGPLESYIFELG